MRSCAFGKLLAVLLFVVLTSACNSSAPSPMQAPPPGGGNQAPAQSASITANPDNTFSPDVVTIAVGGSVSFSNAGGQHNVSTGDFTCAVGCDDMGGNGAPSTASWSFTRTFNTAGTIGFVCDEHSSVGMRGQINVR